MSSDEREERLEQRSSVKISTTAKGEPQVEVKIYDGSDSAEIERIRGLAVSTYIETRRAIAWGGPS